MVAIVFNMRQLLTTLLFLLILFAANAQTTTDFADSIRIKYKIPELAFAIISSDTVFEMQTLGIQRINTNFKAKPNDRFHIGSNTKAITAFIAALLVEQGKIKWDTRFLSLFPELKRESRKEYENITLQDLITFRGKLPGYTYTYEKPTKQQITGSNAKQRYQLAKYFLSQEPMQSVNGLTPSNSDYILAGLMLEKAAKKSFKELVISFGKTQEIAFGFDYPNLSDTLQPWGHDYDLNPLPPFDNYKLNWLLSAGNINVSLSDYVKFIQLQLKGLKGQTKILPAEAFNNLLFGCPTFAFGWFNELDTATNHHIARNEGNAGAFVTQVEIIKEIDRAYIIFTNAASADTKQGMQVIMNRLKAIYGR